jgi:Na+/citrate or Na+/malate symporter
MAKEFLNRSAVMILRAVIGLSYIDEQEIIDAWKKN